MNPLHTHYEEPVTLNLDYIAAPDRVTGNYEEPVVFAQASFPYTTLPSRAPSKHAQPGDFAQYDEIHEATGAAAAIELDDDRYVAPASLRLGVESEYLSVL